MENLHIHNVILNLISENKPNWAAECEHEKYVCNTTWSPFCHSLVPVPYSRKLKQLKTKNVALQTEWEEEKQAWAPPFKDTKCLPQQYFSGREFDKIIICWIGRFFLLLPLNGALYWRFFLLVCSVTGWAEAH